MLSYTYGSGATEKNLMMQEREEGVAGLWGTNSPQQHPQVQEGGRKHKTGSWVSVGVYTSRKKYSSDCSYFLQEIIEAIS